MMTDVIIYHHHQHPPSSAPLPPSTPTTGGHDNSWRPRRLPRALSGSFETFAVVVVVGHNRMKTDEMPRKSRTLYFFKTFDASHLKGIRPTSLSECCYIAAHRISINSSIIFIQILAESQLKCFNFAYLIYFNNKNNKH